MSVLLPELVMMTVFSALEHTNNIPHVFFFHEKVVGNEDFNQEMS